MIFADKTIYIEQLEKFQEDFRYTFLRPRRFGKSAFLNMLCAYYDIHTADHFNDLFGPLYIGKHPTPWRNKHLVLKFDLSSIAVSDSVDAMKESFNNEINGVLLEFIEKYSRELGHPEAGNLIKTNDPTRSLKDVLVSIIFVCYMNTCLIINMLFYEEIGRKIRTYPFCRSR